MNSAFKILVVEDDPHILDMVLYILQKEGYTTAGCTSAESALLHCAEQVPHLIVLDIELPGINGYQFCERLQHALSRSMPIIIMLTDLADVSEMEKGLASCADDYIAKPFNPRILVARIKANLRRCDAGQGSKELELLSYHGIVMDISSRTVRVNDENVRLQKMEFDILALFLSSPNQVFSRDAIISHCKGDNYFITDRAIDNQIYKLRKKLGRPGGSIETVSGVGYRLSGA